VLDIKTPFKKLIPAWVAGKWAKGLCLV
jgi:hypothetical protein